MKFEYILIYILTALLLSCSTSEKSTDTDFAKMLRESRDRINYMQHIDSAEVHESAVSHVVQASTYEQKFEHAKAVLEFMDALKYDTSAAIYYGIAKNYKKLYKMDNALDYAMKSVDIDPAFIPALELLADIYRTELKYLKAIKAYDRILALDPPDPDYYTMLQAFLYEFIDKKKAVSLYEDIYKKNYDEYIATRLQSLYEDLGMDEKRMNILQKRYLENPSDLRAAVAIMDFYIKKDDYGKALTFLFKIDSLVPDSESELYFGYFSEKLLDDTSSAAKKVIPSFLNKMNMRFRFNWRLNMFGGFLADRTGDSTAAGKYFSQTLKVADSIPDIPIQIGSYYLFEGKYSRSMKILNEYQKKFKEDYRFPFFKGICYTFIDSSKPALESLRKAMELEENNIEIYSQIGIVFDRMGSKDSSDYYYKAALELDPDDPLVNNNYAYSLSERGIMLDKAQEMADIALTAEPDNPSYLDTYGWIQYKKGSYETALEYILKSIEKGGDSAEVYEHLAEVYQKLGKTKEARKAWLDALERDPGSEDIKNRLENTD